MYAVFQSGSKQYKVNEGQIVRLEKLNVLTGKVIEFSKVLMIADDEKITIGIPFIKDSIVKAEVIAHGRDKKLQIVKFRRRKHYRKKQGHRQWFTDIRIINIILKM